MKKTEEAFEAQPKMDNNHQKSKKGLVAFIVIALVVAVGYVGMFYFYQQYRKLSANPNQATIKETEELVSEISKLMELPTDETPTLATVLDKSKLKDQPFFKNAENGDKLLAYTKSMKAILYRPSAKKIVEVAPIVIQNTGDGGTSAQPTAQPQSQNQENK